MQVGDKNEVRGLVARLREAGYTGVEIAGYLGVHPRTFRRYEYGYVKMRWTDYEQLVKLVKRVEREGKRPLSARPVRGYRRHKPDPVSLGAE